MEECITQVFITMMKSLRQATYEEKRFTWLTHLATRSSNGITEALQKVVP
jgi:hypothetical protein